jgi:hypothetical protein
MDGRGIEVSAARRAGGNGWRAPALLAVAALAASAGVNAGTATGTFTVQATIASACLVTANTLNFGAYSPTAATALTAHGLRADSDLTGQAGGYLQQSHYGYGFVLVPPVLGAAHSSCHGSRSHIIRSSC